MITMSDAHVCWFPTISERKILCYNRKLSRFVIFFCELCLHAFEMHQDIFRKCENPFRFNSFFFENLFWETSHICKSLKYCPFNVVAGAWGAYYQSYFAFSSSIKFLVPTSIHSSLCFYFFLFLFGWFLFPNHFSIYKILCFFFLFIFCENWIFVCVCGWEKSSHREK